MNTPPQSHPERGPLPWTRETCKECEGKWRVGKGQPARNPDDLEGVRRGIVVRGCRNAGPRERLRESRPHGPRGAKEAQRRRPQALRIFWRKGNRREQGNAPVDVGEMQKR